MNAPEHIPLLVLLVGLIIVISILIRSFLAKIRVPSMIGFFILGFSLRVVNSSFQILSPVDLDVFDFLAKIGVIVLLFRIGLESNLSGLISQFRHAVVNWISDFLISGLIGFFVAYTLFDLSLIPSLFVGIALTATSVGISVGVWQEAKALKTPTGELLTDVAELDDISGIVAMAILFAVIPVLKSGTEGNQLTGLIAKSAGFILIKLVIFGGLCLLFSLFMERHITQYFTKLHSTPSLMLLTVGFGFIIASLAGLLGFSLAIGAFFAGLAFSRDPQSVKIDASFDSVYNLFSPFFFIGIGLNIDPASLANGVRLGWILVLAAVMGKIIANGIPGMIAVGKRGGILLGLSMVPRAEIAMIIMQRGLSSGDWAVPPSVFSAMVMVSAVTCLITPLGVNYLFKYWLQKIKN